MLFLNEIYKSMLTIKSMNPIRDGYVFPKNKVLSYMKYNSDTKVMYLCFIKGELDRQIREYNGVPVELAYKLFYCKTAAELLNIFSTEVKGKFDLLSVKASQN